MKDNIIIRPDFYIHPDYFTVDQVLDQIGENFCKEWNSDYINESKITTEEEANLPVQGRKQRIKITEIRVLNLEQEAEITKSLNKFEKIENSNIPVSFKFGQNIPQLLSEKNPTFQGFSMSPMAKIENQKFPVTIFLLHDDIINPYECKEYSLQPSSSEIMFHKSKLPVNFANNGEVSKLKNLLNLTKARNKLRDALVSKLLPSYIKTEQGYKEIPSLVWEGEKNWGRLLIEGFIKNNEKNLKGYVFFKKVDVNSFLQSQNTKPLVDPLIGEESTPKMRAAARLLYTLLSQRDSLMLATKQGKVTLAQFISSEKKAILVKEIEKIANSLNIKILHNVQEALAGKNEVEIEHLNQNAISAEDIRSIATLLRNLQHQGGNANKKKLDKPIVAKTYNMRNRMIS